MRASPRIAPFLNNFSIDIGPGQHNYVNATCNNTGKFIDVTVEISATTPSNFLQIIYPDALHNEVDAVTRVFPRQPIGLDDAIIGLNPSSCIGGNGVTINGTSETIVNGGNVFSNGCMQGNGNAGEINVNGGGCLRSLFI